MPREPVMEITARSYLPKRFDPNGVGIVCTVTRTPDLTLIRVRSSHLSYAPVRTNLNHKPSRDQLLWLALRNAKSSKTSTENHVNRGANGMQAV